MMTVPMAIVDCIPVILFGVACVILQRDLYEQMSKGCYAVFCAGTIMSITAGACKALWKLLYALEICDFERLNQMFFPLQSIGFVLAAIALAGLVSVPQKKTERLSSVAAVPAVFSGTAIFVTMLCIGTVGICGSLSVIAARMNKKKYGLIFLLSAAGLLMMGYLSSRDFSDPLLNWMGEVVNIFAEGMFLLGVLLLHKAGLRTADIVKK